MTDDSHARPHPRYGTCGGCQQLKHVAPDGLVRVHNHYQARGTVVSPRRCSGSGAQYAELTAPR